MNGTKGGPESGCGDCVPGGTDGDRASRERGASCSELDGYPCAHD